MSDRLSNPEAAQYQPTSQTQPITGVHRGEHQLGTLPFTGVDVAIIVIVAAGMCLMGAALKVLSRDPR